MARTSNKVYNEIADEIEASLYHGAVLPQEFSITLADVEFDALLAGGVKTADGLPVATNTTILQFEIAGRTVFIYSEKYPSPWPEVQ